MYMFEAHYINYKTDEIRIMPIEVEEQFFDTEKDVYLYAMSYAFDNICQDELFSKLDFILFLARERRMSDE